MTCNNKACFENQGGRADGKIEVREEKPEPPRTIEKHTGQPTTKETQGDASSSEPSVSTKGDAPQAKTMDVVDFAAEKMKVEYVSYAKEIKIIEDALVEVFPDMVGDERGMKTKLLWNVKHPSPI